MRTARTLALAALLASTLTAGLVGGGGGSATAAPGDPFAPRWCATSPAPCLESATLDGVPVTALDPDWEIQLSDLESDPGGDYQYFQWLLVERSSTRMSTADEWRLVLDTGTLRPRYTEGYSSRTDVDRADDGDGTHHVTYQGRPVLVTSGCTDTYPVSCPWQADDWYLTFSGEVSDKASLGEEWDGFDRSQNVDGVQYLSLETAPDGSKYLATEMYNSHVYDADRGPGVDETIFVGETRFRLPYRMLRDSFGVPDPATMVAGSLTGTVSGTTSAPAWNVFHDPAGGGLIVDVSNLTFSKRLLKLRRGVITPTRPADVRTDRVKARKGTVRFDRAEPRGAEVRGYRVRCVARRGDHVAWGTDLATAGGQRFVMRLAGLRVGVAYDCQARATSKAGPGPWSPKKLMPSRP